MRSKKQRERMRDYLVEKLRESGEKVEPAKKRILSHKKSNMILVKDSGIVFLVDREYSEEDFKDIYWRLGRKTAYVFYKDGIHFFNTNKRKRYRKKRVKSLRHYTEEEFKRLVYFSSAERLIHFQRNSIHYYQPDSNKTPERLETYFFRNLEFDYNNPSANIPSLKRESRRLFIWEDRSFGNSDLILRNGLLVPGQEVANLFKVQES
ncbi:hypothetical protein DRN73_06190 [Candidatus Pacearchaeota archaeon]|nr:MAG: hypothetical protein DRN73_06190 [Candidatus Pacearchaeota archaeon]